MAPVNHDTSSPKDHLHGPPLRQPGLIFIAFYSATACEQDEQVRIANPMLLPHLDIKK